MSTEQKCIVCSFYLSHYFWNQTLKHQNHTPNLQNYTLILGLWISFQFHKTRFAKHNKHVSM